MSTSRRDECERALSALHSLDPSMDRETWLRTGMAAHAAGVTFDEFDAWSAGGENYDASGCKAMWRSIKPGAVKAGTLFKLALDAGWRDDTHSQLRPLPARAPKPAPTRPTSKPSAPEVWARLEPATEAHGYIVAKQGRPNGLRVVPAGDRLKIAGHSLVGWLAVPVMPLAGGEPVSLQFIPPPGQGQKLNLRGAPMAGVFVVGDLEAGGTAYLCEGIGQAWACWRAKGGAAVVTFGWGRVRAVASELRQRDPSARLVLVPDAGKEADAEGVAREVGALVAHMPEGSPRNFDAWDLAQRDGADALESLLDSAQAPYAPPEAAPPWRVIPLDNLAATPPLRWVWDSYIPREQVTLFGAHGGTGKSTIALMLAVSVALGRPMFGVDTEASPVVFFSAEDSAQTTRMRLARILPAVGVTEAELRGRLTILDATDMPAELAAPMWRHDAQDARNSVFGLTTTGDKLAELLATATGPLLIVDNASDTFGGDENARSDVRAFVRILAGMVRKQQGAVLLLAHIDKTAARGFGAGQTYSGSTAWHNSARSRLAMKREADGALVIEHEKSNLGPLRDPLRLAWPRDGVPMLDAPAAGIVGAIVRDNRTSDLLRLIADANDRGEKVSTAVTGPACITSAHKESPLYPRRAKPAEVVECLRDAERKGWLERETFKTVNRKTQEGWRVTKAGREAAGVFAAPVAQVAPVPWIGATSATGSRPAPVAPVPVPGVWGERSAQGTTASTSPRGGAT